ncbi:MAG: sensor histidine kinase [Chloroflexi bacterium]|nr:sensor histidine kinase [Chloroflexota bacterium]
MPGSWPPITLDSVLIAVVIVLSVGMAASVVVPSLHVHVVAPSLDLVLNTLATAVTLAVALLGWGRFRESGEPMAVFWAAAFLVLAIANGLLVVLAVTGLERQAGLALEAPGQAPLYVFAFARVFAAALLVLGGIASIRRRRVDHAPVIVLGSAAAMLLIIALAQLGADRLPSLGSIGVLGLQGNAPGAGSLLPHPMPLGAAMQVLGAALFLWAAGLSRRLYLRDRGIGDGYLVIGLVFAAFAQVDAAASPSVYTGLATSGDILRLAFDVILLLGIIAETQAAFSRLRRAHADQARLQVVELEHAALEERTRLSRELHDGLAQDLWLAKLKTGRLAALPDLGLEGRALAGELGEAIDAGLVEAQQAVASLRRSAEPTGTLSEVMARSVDEFADRFGLRAEFEAQAGLPRLSPRVQAEALRIAQEALNNVRRHADATVVRVRAAVEGGHLVLVVHDNGRGFDPSSVGRSAFGIASMRERAALIGGEVRIESRPQDGTRISLLVPVPLVVAPASEGIR